MPAGRLETVMELPQDITNKINTLFTLEADRVQATQLLEGLWTESLTVGPAQLARSMLILSKGDLQKMRELKKNYRGDPRDILMEAEGLLGNPGHYFIEPFED